MIDKEKMDILLTVDEILCDKGMTFSEFLSLRISRDSSMLDFSDGIYNRFKELYAKINETDAFVSRKEKGTLLEELTALLFSDNLLNVIKNARTSTNEIDILLTWNNKARISSINTVYDSLKEPFICECKNYKGKVDVTYVGKFYSLLSVSGTKLGVLVAWEGVTGSSPWLDALGLIKKIALKHDTYILILDKNDFKRIYDREVKNIFKLLDDKYIALKHDINFNKHLSHHENEDIFTQ